MKNFLTRLVVWPASWHSRLRRCGLKSAVRIPRSALALLLVCSLSLLLLRLTPAGTIIDETWGSGWQSRWTVIGHTVVYSGPNMNADHTVRVYTNCGVATEYTVSVRADSTATYGYQLHFYGGTDWEDSEWDLSAVTPQGSWLLGSGNTEIGNYVIGCNTGVVLSATGSTITLGTLTDVVMSVQDGRLSSGTVAILAPLGSMPSVLPSRVVIEGPDNTPPTQPTSLQAGTSVRHEVSLSWNRSTDSGSGLQYYTVCRNGADVASVDPSTCGSDPQRCSYTDGGLLEGTMYTYTVAAVDWEANVSSPSNTALVTTLRAPQERPEGLGAGPLTASYGSGAEQINLESGNLTLRIPIIPIQGRSPATSPTLSLVYNSQLWTWDGAGARLALVDAGYGPGWTFWLGAIYPVYVNYMVDHYRYIDSSGATHRLYPTAGDLYVSRDSTYMVWDRALNRLTFRDGTVWSFNYLASDGGPDSGTRYATGIQDTNGNSVAIAYTTGARIDRIWDCRSTNPYEYRFNYTANNRLQSIDETYYQWYCIGGCFKAPAYSLTRFQFEYSAETTLLSPFGGSETAPAQKLLTKVRRATGAGFLEQEIQYNDRGEVTKLTLPYGGYFRYDYDIFSFANNAIKRREVTRRYWSSLPRGDANYGSPAYEKTDNLTRATGDASHSGHNQATLNDAAGNRKIWYFTQGDTLGWKNGLQWKQEVYQGAGVSLLRTFQTDWTQDQPAVAELRNPRPAAQRTVLNDVTPALESRREQEVDANGNITQVREFGYGDAVNPVRALTVTYLTTTPYTSRSILNRPLTTQLHQGGAAGPVLMSSSVQYDATALMNVTPAPSMHDGTYGTSFTARGNATHVTPLGGRQTVTTYDILGNPRYVVDAAGHVLKSASYDSSLGYTAPTAISSGAPITVNTLYNGDLAPAVQTATSGEQASYGWDAAKRPTEATSPSGQRTTYQYNDSATPPTVVATVAISRGVRDGWAPGSYTITSTLDGFGRVVKTQDSRTNAYVKHEYDSCSCSPNGREMKVSNPYLSGETPLWTTSEYDVLGRVTRVTAPDGSITATSFAGNATTVTDPAGKRKKFTYDAFGALTQVAEPDAQGNLTVLTNYTYDVPGRLTLVSMNGGAQTRSFTYNEYGEVASATNPENGTVSYTYNTDGTLASKTDAKNQVMNFDYDSYHRVTRIYPPQGAGYGYEKRFYYDSYPADPGYYIYGRLAAIEWSQPSLQIGQYLHTYEYAHVFGYWINGTVMRSKLTQKDTYNGQTVSRSLEADFAWTVQGTASKVTYPSGRLLFYNFDTGGRLDGLQQLEAGGFPDADLVTGASYNKAGQPLTMDFLDSATVRETRSYDPNTLQLTGIQVPGALDLSYVYPAAPANNGRITAETNNLTNTTVSYGYDQLNRLSTASSVTGSTTNWGLSFSYDVYGNRTAQTVTAGSAPAFSATFGNNNRMVGYSYDNNGNQLNTPDGATLSYDWDNRMTNWSSGGASETYHYHPSGSRVWKKKSTEAEGTLYLYGPGGQLLCERSDSGSTAADYMYFGGRLLYTARYQSGTWTQTAMYTDRLGTVRSAGGAARNYYPFGEEIGTPSANNTYKFASTYRDSTTGLDYAVNRYYASGTARFLTPDPYQASGGPADPQSWNRYAYTRGDPVNRADPTGLQDCPSGMCSFYTPIPSLAPSSGLGGGGGGDGNGMVVVAGDPSGGEVTGVGGGPTPAEILNGLLTAAKARVKADLAKPDCAADFKDVSAVMGKIDQITFSSQGPLKFHSEDGQPVANRRSPGLGRYNPLTGSISLNSNVNWLDPSQTPATLDGKNWTYNALGAQAAALGAAAVSAQQLMDLAILHELSHYKGAIGSPDKSPGVEQKLWKDCIK
jgi:RHS repeat-associated protein